MNTLKGEKISKRHVQKTAIQFMFIFFIIYLLFNTIATLFYFIQGYEAYGSNIKNDSLYYHTQASLIAETGNFSMVALPYEYIVGVIYYLVGADLGPYAFKFVMSCVASINIYLIISIIGNISIYHNVDRASFNKWSKIICLLILIYPTYNFYVLNMYRDMMLVSGSLLFVYTFISIIIYKSKSKLHYFLILTAILFVTILRPYFGFFMIMTILVYFFMNRKNLTLRNISILIGFILIIGFLMKFTKYGLFGVNYLSGLANLQALESYRKFSSTGNLILDINIAFSNPILFVPTYLQAFIVNHIYPLPSYFGNISSILFLPENMIITFILIGILKKVIHKVKKYGELRFLLIYYLLNVGFIVSFSDNIGTNIRLRMSFVLCLFIMFFISKLPRAEGRNK